MSERIFMNSQSNRARIRELWCARLTSLALFVVSGVMVWIPAEAATFPWKDAVFSYRAESTALLRMLEDIFVTQQRPVEISSAVKELPPVSGDFRQTPRKVFDDLAHSFGLVAYFDGTKMYVTTLAENTSVIKGLAKVSARDVENAARQFGYLDRRFGFRAGGAPYTLQLNGPPAYIERISEVIAALEATATQHIDGAQLGIRVIALKHAWANDITYDVGGRSTVVRGVANSLRSLVEGLEGQGGEVVRDTGFGVPGLPVSPDRRPTSVLESLIGRVSGGGEQAEIQPPLPPVGTDLERTGNGENLHPGKRAGALVRVVGDSRTNAVILMAPVNMLSMLEDVVRDLDVEPELVQIEAAIIDVQDGALREIGFDWTLKGKRFEMGSANSGRSTGSYLNDLGNVVGIGPNLAIFGGTTAENFLGRIHALQGEGKASVLSRPKLATLSGIEAVVTNQEVFYPSIRSERVAQLYQVEVGLQMRVVPAVVRRSDGSADIRLQVFIADGSLSERQVGEFPVTRKSAITTQALVRNGESLLIGGYVQDRGENRQRKVPLLGDIPLLGALFRFRSMDINRQERLFLITPRLLTERGAGESQALGLNSREQGVIERFAIREAAPNSQSGSRGVGMVAPASSVGAPIVSDADSASGQPSSDRGAN
ncbi:secretin N-terminal domain-containing protein [Burkholderia ubonensis]|uniref:secretin N-terminal domain-containing protein n=1 Tax=Burkholderia ubonensis TaxID=101571 RepID=UPI000A7AB28B|nr:secretin N-terminal domain-containing protein [Burkholderia ubonensis]